MSTPYPPSHGPGAPGYPGSQHGAQAWPPGGFPPPAQGGPAPGGTGSGVRWPPGPGGQQPHPQGGPGGQWPSPQRNGNGSGGKGPLIAVVVAVVSVVLIGGLAGGWLLLSRDEAGPPAGPTSDRGNPVRSATAKEAKTTEAVKLRTITGDQLCAAVPDDLRKSLVADAEYGGKDASTGAATDTEKRAACSWTNNKMDVGNGVLGYRALSISVAAKSAETRNAVEYATDRFDQDKKAHERRVNVRNGKRIDGRTSGSAFGELKALKYGDASYSQSSIGMSGLKTEVYVRQGPWQIKVTYGGDNRTGAKYPSGDETRVTAGKVAELITAEMAKSADKVKLTGPCGIVTAKQIESAFFPAAGGPSVSTSDGRIEQTACIWSVREVVKHRPGQEFTARGGELGFRVVDWGGGDTGSTFQFDRDAKKYDRYHDKGGLTDDRLHVAYEPRQELSGLGEKAFVVVSSTTKRYDKSAPPMMEILIKVLVGDRTVEVTFRGTTTGGGLVDAAGYRAPFFESAVAQPALTKVAKTFLDGLK
ncbi:hypothetical protein AB0C18_13010 [Nonomuraea muscovyensis]|uniref:hypothetical protein n=1 Tax=Nonomuraea muscovyensis TaxID=1124761 RepID=UPI0033DC420E